MVYVFTYFEAFVGGESTIAPLSLFPSVSRGGVGLDLKIRKTRLGKAGFSGNKFPEER